MDLNGFVFYGALVALVGTPIAAPFLVRVMSRQELQFRRLFYSGVAVFVALIIAARVLSLSFSLFEANIVAVYTAYFCFGLLALAAFHIKPKLLGIIVGTVCSLPLFGGALLGTIGFLVLLFIIGDAAPVYKTELENGATCRVTTFGNATTSVGGRDVYISRPLLPGIEKDIIHKRVIDGDSYLSHETVCKNVGAAYVD